MTSWDQIAGLAVAVGSLLLAIRGADSKADKRADRIEARIDRVEAKLDHGLADLRTEMRAELHAVTERMDRLADARSMRATEQV